MRRHTPWLGGRRLVTGLIATLAVASVPCLAMATELELPLYGGLLIPTEREPSLAPGGPVAGLSPLVRISRPFALGLVVEHARLAWSAEGPSGDIAPGSTFPDDEGSHQLTLVMPAVRWYFLDVAPVHPYVQLSIGYLDYLQIPDHPDCSVEDGLGGQLRLGADYGFAPWGRVGLAAAATPFGLGQGCSDIGYPGKPPPPPHPGFGIGLLMGLTTVWGPAEGDAE